MERQHGQNFKSLYVIGTAVVCLLLLLPALRLIPAGAQIQPPAEIGKEPALDGKIEAFFGALRQGNTASAFDDLLKDSPYSLPSSGTSASELRGKVDALKGQIGDIVRWEKLDEKSVGVDIIIYRYILKYDLYPVIWTFYFYRKPTAPTALSTTTNTWGLHSVYFDPDLRNL